MPVGLIDRGAWQTAVVGQGGCPWEQAVKIGRLAIGNLFKEIGERGIWMQAILFGRLDQAIDDGARFRAVGRIGEQPVFPANDHRLDTALAAIVIELQSAIL